MIKYEVSEIKRVGDYRFLLTILNQHSIREIEYENKGKEGKLSFWISKKESSIVEKKLKESGLVFRILE